VIYGGKAMNKRFRKNMLIKKDKNKIKISQFLIFLIVKYNELIIQMKILSFSNKTTIVIYGGKAISKRFRKNMLIKKDKNKIKISQFLIVKNKELIIHMKILSFSN
jgi:hypothetical protein